MQANECFRDRSASWHSQEPCSWSHSTVACRFPHNNSITARAAQKSSLEHIHPLTPARYFGMAGAGGPMMSDDMSAVKANKAFCCD